MFHFKRDNKTELRTKCTYCNGNLIQVIGDISARSVKCSSCGATFDGVAEAAERSVYEQQKAK